MHYFMSLELHPLLFYIAMPCKFLYDNRIRKLNFGIQMCLIIHRRGRRPRACYSLDALEMIRNYFKFILFETRSVKFL